MLGDVVAVFESGNLGYDAISNTPNDPGGASYGRYQISSATGTLQAFLKSSKYWTSFAGMSPGSGAFNAHWLLMCKEPEFCTSQWQFIKDTHFMPVINYWTSQYQLLRDNSIDEALWSMSIQHGLTGNKIIIDNMQDAIPDNYTRVDILNNLYHCRKVYVSGLNIVDNIKESLYNRYKYELEAVLKIED